ncbi:P-type cation-transporting ATPase [Ceratocystis lukuohia]|uniref:P-type cation-transporting ATPase n=1 Tax=Ceratocystis lukuohia TaxID=2019550 RepID=A0ABR4MGD6_9PEZI
MGKGCCGGSQLLSIPGRQVSINEIHALPTGDDACPDPLSEEASTAMNQAPRCCSSKEECDEQCAIIAASLDSKQDGTKDTTIHRSSSEYPSHNFNQAFEKYMSLLETVKCICRSVLEDQGISCCDQKANATQANKPKSISCSEPNDGPTTCCPSQNEKPSAPQDDVCRARISSGFTDQKTKSGCCSKSQAGVASCGSAPPAQAPKPKGGCCSPDATGTNKICAIRSNANSTPKTAIPAPTNRAVKAHDLEKDAGYEHVALSVEGMTCNDCAEKLSRTLKNIPGTQNIRVNFIRGQADFDLEPSLSSIDSILAIAQNSTGFILNRFKQGGEALNLLVPKSNVKALTELSIDGLRDVAVLDESTVQVEYDPKVIGARDLLGRLGDLSTGLAPPGADPAVSGGRRKFYKLLITTVLSTLLTIPVVVLAWGEDIVSEFSRGIVSFVLGSLVQALAVPVFYKPALRALIIYHALELDMLVVVSISAAYLYSVVAFSFRMAGKPLETAEFFETSTLLITLVMLGRLLASFARIRAVAAVSMRSLQSTTALIVKGDDESEQEIDSRLLQYGDIFKVLPHCRIPTDGVIIRGISDVDESMLTGESIPVHKQPGFNVIAGTVNNTGTLLVRLTELPGRNTVMDIARMVEEASNSKPRVQDLADRVASYFLPTVSTTALLVFIIWVIVGIKGRNESAAQSVPVALTYAIAVLAVSCPCALGLAVPMVLVIAGGIAARGGVIIKSAECTERSRKVTDVVFDKTGTLTEPDLDVFAEEFFGNARDDIAGVARALVSESKHPVSLAVAKFLADVNHTVSISELQSFPGAGVEAFIDGVIFRAGNPQWTGNQDNSRVRQFLDQGLTILLITRDSTPVALFGLRTRIRPEAFNVVSDLKRRGITVHLVSGDQRRAVAAIASSVGIDNTNAVAQYTPDQKQAYVASLMEKNKYVLFCGDGTNDAVAVAQANIGAQISDSVASSDVTSGAADVVLLSGLNGIPFLLDLSKASFRRIVFNFAWSATYNVLAILLAGGAFVEVRISPAYAGAGELVSVLPVIAAAMSMLLLKLKPSGHI